MSLATTSISAGAGVGAGAVAMAHQPHAMTQHVQGPKVTSGANTRTTAAPRSASGLAADMVDKNINPKLIRNSKHLPIVCMDLYGEGQIAYAAGEGMTKEVLEQFVTLGTVGESKADLSIKRNEAAYKAIRKLLSKGEKGGGYYDRALASSISTKSLKDGNEIVTISRPHLLLGARRLAQLHSNILSEYPHSADDLKPVDRKESAASAAIQQFDEISSETGIAIKNQSLDGSAASGTDFDRVALQLDLLPKKKKPLTLLPDEAVGILLAKARHLVESDVKAKFPDALMFEDKEGDNDDDEKEVEQYLNYPMALAVPGWHMSDASVEAHLEAILGAGSEGMVYHRTVAALAGALLPRGMPGSGKNMLRECVSSKANQTKKELEQKQLASKKSGKIAQHDFNVVDMQPLVIAMGITTDGIEGMACQLSNFQTAQLANIGKIRALTEVSLQNDNPLSNTQVVLEKIIEGSVHKLLPKENHVPCAIITFGNADKQKQLKASIQEVLKIKENEWGMINGGSDGKTNVPILATGEEAVAMGAIALAAGSHGRITTTEGKKVNVSVNNASTCEVGIRYMYFDDDKNESTANNNNIKVIFEFDRLVPASYTSEFTAAECAAVKAQGKNSSKFDVGNINVEEVTKYTGSGNIPIREQAARSFKIQIVQKCGRQGKWVNVGDIMEPLNLEDDEGDGKFAIESSFLDISVSAAGLIVTKFYSDR